RQCEDGGPLPGACDADCPPSRELPLPARAVAAGGTGAAVPGRAPRPRSEDPAGTAGFARGASAGQGAGAGRRWPGAGRVGCHPRLPGRALRPRPCAVACARPGTVGRTPALPLLDALRRGLGDAAAAADPRAEADAQRAHAVLRPAHRARPGGPDPRRLRQSAAEAAPGLDGAGAGRGLVRRRPLHRRRHPDELPAGSGRRTRRPGRAVPEPAGLPGADPGPTGLPAGAGAGRAVRAGQWLNREGRPHRPGVCRTRPCPHPDPMHIEFDNSFLRELPGDPEAGPRVREVAAAWSRVDPTPVTAPQVLAWSPEAAALVGLGAQDIADPDFAAVFGGNALLEGMQPWSANYGGHQFGHWAGQLGDGRAISLGEAIGAAGERWELQLKGAGRTPYSRFADGRAVLRSSLREFVCSEAMHHLGVPTTRALSLVGTGEDVVRDMFYDGHPRPEPGAVVCRMAPSFLRFGSWQLPASRGDTTLLRQLTDHVQRHHFPDLHGRGAAGDAEWFAQVCERTAWMVAGWIRVGFVHGVMNTDNMSILGLTIDHGPYCWLEDYDPDWTPNTTDAQGRRYRYGTQPQVAYWNLTRLAQALAPLFGEAAPLEAGLQRFLDAWTRAEREMVAGKLGLARAGADDV